MRISCLNKAGNTTTEFIYFGSFYGKHFMLMTFALRLFPMRSSCDTEDSHNVSNGSMIYLGERLGMYIVYISQSLSCSAHAWLFKTVSLHLVFFPSSCNTKWPTNPLVTFCQLWIFSRTSSIKSSSSTVLSSWESVTAFRSPAPVSSVPFSKWLFSPTLVLLSDWISSLWFCPLSVIYWGNCQSI